MGLTKRKDSYYVEFPVMDDGKLLTLAQGGGGRLKRWKVGSLNKTVAKQQEAIYKTDLMKGTIQERAGYPRAVLRVGLDVFRPSRSKGAQYLSGSL